MTSRITNRVSTTQEDEGRRVAKDIIHKYFTTQTYPYTKHHIDSFDQFLSTDLISILRSNNPIRIYKERIKSKDAKEKINYQYNIEIYVGGKTGDKVQIGTPVTNLDQSNDVRVLFPNEARLRNLTYASDIKVDIDIDLVIREPQIDGSIETNKPINLHFEGINLFTLPIMLHSRFCLLNNKPKEFLQQAGECPFDNGGYFIIDGSEKVLISRQESAFNTFFISKHNAKDTISNKISIDGYVTSLDPETRSVSSTSFAIDRTTKIIYATFPMIRAPINIFIAFRALGIQADEDIVRMIFPDPTSADAQFLQDALIPSIIDAYPFLTKTVSLQYLKTLTKGFTEATVLDILTNRLFTHIPNSPGARATYMAECIRSLLRVEHGFENPLSRDDTRNQRCLNSGFLVQDMFNSAYKDWKKAIRSAIDNEYAYHTGIYSGQNFVDIFRDANRSMIFKMGYITDLMMKAFKGKWGSGLGEEKTGVLQALSRLSYLDFMSHCRRVVRDFDTNKKLVGPRQLHTSQYGFFCTSETPSGKSIGITKNLTIMATISTGMKPAPLIEWLFNRGGVVTCASVTANEKSFYVPVIINNGIIGYTANPLILLKVLKAMKHTGFLPYFISISFSYNMRRLMIFTDEGRPLRPLIMIGPNGHFPTAKIASTKTWRDLVIGTHPARQDIDLSNPYFVDPLADRAEGQPTAEDYLKAMLPYESVIEYIDPYEQNEILIANFKEQIVPGQTTHVEIHPSTILSLLTSLVPFANHNQSPRNQLSDSQSKQSISIYATNWKNRFDNSGHIAVYSEAPISRTLYYDYLAEGRIPYGTNCILAICTYQGYNRDDGFVINKQALERGLFRTIAYRSYEFFEEHDKTTNMKKRIGNPANIGQWLDIRPGLDYTKLDERGIVKVGEYVDEDTVIVGGYYQAETGKYKDASLTPKVWTRGIVESVNITVSNEGLRLVKVRVVQDRSPELGDKKSNRHGQKGTLGAIIPQADMPRTHDGIVPDIIANPHAIPSRMTMAMLLEALLGKAAACHGSIGDATTFMNEGNPTEQIGSILENMYGYERYGNEILYDGTTGGQLEVEVFIGPTYYMRLKHMVEDKWQARTTGRKEAKTHQPTGGRGNEGGIRFGELERDVVVTHGAAAFLHETIMKRSDGEKIPICSGCGNVPIYNEKLGIAICPYCQGPLKYAGTSADTLEMIPPITKPVAPIVKVEMPYCMKVLEGELGFYANIGMRFIPTAGVSKLNDENIIVQGNSVDVGTGPIILPEFRIPDAIVPELEPKPDRPLAAPLPNFKDLVALANQVGMTLVPSNSAMARNNNTVEEGAKIMTANEINKSEKIIEGSADDEMPEVPEEEGEEEEEVQLIPGGIPQPVKVLGSKAPPQNVKIVPPAPLMTNEQMASMLVNTAINQPAVFAQAANQMNQAMAPTAPTLIVDTSPRALALEGLGNTEAPMPASAPMQQQTIRLRRRAPATPVAPATPAPVGPVVVNKLA